MRDASTTSYTQIYRHLLLDRQTPLQHLELDEQRDLDLKHEGCTAVGNEAAGVVAGAGAGATTGVGAGGDGYMKAIWLRIR